MEFAFRLMDSTEQRARELLARVDPGVSWGEMIDYYGQHPNLLVNTPTLFLAAAPMLLHNRGPAWFVYLLAGDIGEAMASAPEYRPWICWGRVKTKRLHWARIERIRALTHGRLQHRTLS